jgi:uncharacterized protein YbaA (DUF1428 family)
MERYVDGFVLPVSNDAVEEYRAMAAEGGKLWIEHGALEYFEGVGDDMDPSTGSDVNPDGDGMSTVSFPELAGTADDETVVFSFIVYESRELRRGDALRHGAHGVRRLPVDRQLRAVTRRPPRSAPDARWQWP